MARRNSILVSRSLYQIGYVTLVAAIVWVGVGIYIAANKNVVKDVDKATLEPINPVIDQEVIKALSSRLKIELDITPVVSEVVVAATPSAASVSATPSATIEEGI